MGININGKKVSHFSYTISTIYSIGKAAEMLMKLYCTKKKPLFMNIQDLKSLSAEINVFKSTKNVFKSTLLISLKRKVLPVLTYVVDTLTLTEQTMKKMRRVEYYDGINFERLITKYRYAQTNWGAGCNKGNKNIEMNLGRTCFQNEREYMNPVYHRMEVKSLCKNKQKKMVR